MQMQKQFKLAGVEIVELKEINSEKVHIYS